MKKLFFPVLLVAASIISCSSTPNVSDLTDKDWKLIKVHVAGADTLFSRDSLPKIGGEDYFTLKVDGQTLSGKGAPNLYSGPYTQNSDKTISVKPLRSTLMAAIFEPDTLKEHDFYAYLQNAYEWKIVKNNLEINSKTKDGKDVRLVFSL